MLSFSFMYRTEKGTNTERVMHLLQDLQLAHVHDLVADAVGRHLQQVLEQGDAPADQGGDDPGLVRQVLRWPYQAKVMKTLLSDSKMMVVRYEFMEPALSRTLPES